ncbi:MAG: PaaX domain-containing protein, C- domain protein [Actinomycetia bacterium]|nr:PaaX domain-containing protein, C- domain protein [Actinomycetes bacterium]
MTGRSVVLSVLLGAHPAWATVGELLALTSDFGIRESTVRVALTRMVASGDLVRSADGYRLSDRLLARQRRQDDAINPRRRSWDGTWTTLVITSVGTDPRTRAALRNSLQEKRFAELREGVWMRPDNVAVELGDAVSERVRLLRARDEAPVELAARLWDLSGWASAGRAMLTAMAASGDVPGRFVIAASMVRHLLTDPVLPDELLPEDWPGAALRTAYEDFAAELVARRDGVELAEVP